MAWWHQAFNNPAQRAAYGNQFSGGQVAEMVQVQNRQAAQAGAGVANAIAGGAAQAASECYNAGAQIGSAILSGLTDSLGASGQAIQRFGSQLLNAFTDALGAGIGGISKLLGLAGKAVGAGIGAVTTGIGAVIGGVAGAGIGSVPGFMVGAYVGSIIGSAITKAIDAVSSALGGVVSAVGKVAGILGQTLVSALESVKTILTDITNTAGQFGRLVGGIRAAGNGALSYGQAGSLAYSLGAFGVNPMGMVRNQNPLIRDRLARIFGAPSLNDPNMIAGTASRLQQLQRQGLGGQFRGQYMLDALGMNDPQSRWMLNLPVNKIREQQSWQNKTQAAMGISPEAMQRWAEDLPLLQQRLEIFFSMLKTKFADLLSPMIFKGLESLTQYLAAHAKDITESIKSAVRWIYADLPIILLNAGKSIATGALAIVEGFRTVGHGFASFVRALGEGNEGWANFIESFLGGIDGLSTGLNNFVPALAAVSQTFYNFFSLLSQVGTGMLKLLITPLQWVANHISAPLLDRMGLSGLGSAASAFGQMQIQNLDQVTGMSRITAMAAYANNVYSDTHLAEAFHNLRGARNWGKDADSIDRIVDKMADGATTKLKETIGWLDSKLKSAGSVEERRAIIDQLSQIARNTAVTADATRGLHQGGTEGFAKLYARAAAYVAEDSFTARY